jgi:hypothetical protein
MTKCHEKCGLLLKADNFIAFVEFSCPLGHYTLRDLNCFPKWKDFNIFYFL